MTGETRMKTMQVEFILSTYLQEREKKYSRIVKYDSSEI
jgi:hypothetical protein